MVPSEHSQDFFYLDWPLHLPKVQARIPSKNIGQMLIKVHITKLISTEALWTVMEDFCDIILKEWCQRQVDSSSSKDYTTY